MSTQVVETILQREQAFFDHEARHISDDELRIPADQIARYRNAKHHALNTAKDELFANLLPLQGKRVVDYGCGTGDLACELALCGAEVTASILARVSCEGSTLCRTT